MTFCFTYIYSSTK